MTSRASLEQRRAEISGPNLCAFRAAVIVAFRHVSERGIQHGDFFAVLFAPLRERRAEAVLRRVRLECLQMPSRAFSET